MSCVTSPENAKSCRAFDNWKTKARRCISISFTASSFGGGSPPKGRASDAPTMCLSQETAQPTEPSKKEKLRCSTHREKRRQYPPLASAADTQPLLATT